MLTAAGDIYANGGWMRVSGNQGLYFESYGGGWHMTDASWIRSYNGKDVYISAFLRADNGIASGAVGSLGGGTIHASSYTRTTYLQDYDDTGYYLDPNSTSNSALRIRGGALHGPNPSWGKYLLVGGDGRGPYVDNVDVASVSTTDGNLHVDASSAHGLYLNYYDGNIIYLGNGANGTSGYVNTTGSISMNTGYQIGGTAASGTYLRGNGSNFVQSAIQAGDLPAGSGNYIQNQYAGEQSANFWVSGTGNVGKLKFKGEGGNSGIANDAYAIYQESGSWTFPYPDLAIGFHTGIKLGAHYSYNGIRFYNNHDFATQTFSVGDGDNNVRVYYNIATVGDIVSNQNYGLGLVGLYASTRYQNVFAMGAAYRLAADGTNTGNLYGLAWSHPNAGGVAGNLNTHGLLVMENGTFLAAVSGSIRARDDMRAPIFYDSNNTGYYTDPNGTSEMNVFTRGTLARSSLNALQNNSPVTTRSVQGDTYKTGAMGWGTTDFNTIYSNWGSGFIDTWSNPGNAPGGSSHYVGLQGFHYNHMDGTNAYGFQMAMAGEANNRFFWRSGWPSPRPWVEMVHSGNIGSFGIHNQYSYVQGANFIISGTGRSDGDFRAPIFYDQNNTGYYADPNGVSNLAGITTSVNYNTFHTWTNLPNHAGLYSSNHNGAHFYPNDGSYGSWRILGTRNGWAGLEFPSGGGNISLMIGQGGWGGMTTGMHANSYGWLWRFEHQTLYAARWVDSDNNTYYFDGHSTSLVTGDFYISHHGGVLRVGHGAYGGDWCCGGYDWWGCQGWCSNIRLSVYGGAESMAWYGWSDGRFKKDVQTVSNALDLVKSMRGVFYNWTFEGTTPSYDEVIKAAEKKEYNPEDIEASDGSPPGSRIGVIAQEIQEILPQVVTRVEDKDTAGTVIGHHYSVNYNDIVPVLIEAIKEQQVQIEELKAKVFGISLPNNITLIAEKLKQSEIPDKNTFTEFIESIKNKNELDQQEKLKLEMLKTKLGIK